MVGALRQRVRVVVDTAGGSTGGAQRFRDELDGYLLCKSSGVAVIGRGRRVDATWMLAREVRAVALRADRAVATNNAAFLAAGRERWVLLRNTLNFLTGSEREQLPAGLRPSPDWDSAAMRLLARRADVLVVPSSAMAERVCAVLPSVAARVVVRPHPVRRRQDVAGERVPGRVICPVTFDAHKDMPRRASLLDRAARLARTDHPDLHVLVTAEPDQVAAAGVGADSPLVPIGRQTTKALEGWLATSTAVFFPPTLESFGFPLAEARVNRQPIVAAMTGHNAEVAGDALVPYSSEDPVAWSDALTIATHLELDPSVPNPYDPERYFDWLLFGRPATGPG